MALSHKKLSVWYHQLAQQLEAGLTLAESLRSSRDLGPGARTLTNMAAAIETGGSTDDALRTAGDSLPVADRLFLSAAAAAGRMPRTLHVLSDRHAELSAAKLRALLACLYPLAVLHLGLVLLPLVRMIDWEKGFTWDASAYLRGLSLVIVPVWTGIVVFWILSRADHPAVVKGVRTIPIVGSYLKAQSLSDFAFGLGNFLEAGIPIDRAWKTAAMVSRSSELNRAAKEMTGIIEQGQPPGRYLDRWPCFPPDFVALYRTGETSGQLESNLFRLAATHQQDAQRALKLATIVYPGILFVCVAIGVAYFVISIYGGYLKMLTDVAQ
jgi:general secretion pathway protein F/type IV pilus assembly protein PilC